MNVMREPSTSGGITPETSTSQVAHAQSIARAFYYRR
jgi:hypothetical protein